MADYSDLLRVALQEYGENDEIWGEVANQGVFLLLEAAIAGRVEIGLGSANATLSQQNGATDQARNMILHLTGVLAVPRVVNVPATSKLYLVWNATTGDQQITITPAGGTGVVLPGTGAYWVFVDGVSPPVARLASSGVATSAATATVADNALALGGVLASLFARKDQGPLEGQTFSKAQTVNRVVLTASGSNVAINASLSNCFSLVMNGNYSILTPTNPTDGQTIRLIVRQTAIGGATLGFSGAFAFPNGIVPTLTPDPNARDYFGFEYYAADAVWIGNILKDV